MASAILTFNRIPKQCMETEIISCLKFSNNVKPVLGAWEGRGIWVRQPINYLKKVADSSDPVGCVHWSSCPENKLKLF